jgi:hypothetical protein
MLSASPICEGVDADSTEPSAVAAEECNRASSAQPVHIGYVSIPTILWDHLHSLTGITGHVFISIFFRRINVEGKKKHFYVAHGTDQMQSSYLWHILLMIYR